ncbi:hypothetical protein A7K93_08275 [Candidatus Methylacidiphilum fumarolicum]|nr:hypothetical protein [Candidatus Methylacidiphilum fumarolicum]TFE65541.1 hypothetical protein A7K73_02560 [Candidatus Methylacidiphilum fumarolicum]TFE72664.1 hypothetical protein A7K93_08275 [Candidatus Methylacidiphilum fumarolicum]TFE75155.1 hypothetical protein A7K72_02290 [Candidatus Methylacidiphilum fumarolicum]TFE77400.1 hypothetical protein A7D33_04705 [Candidatus Methylacidiphilum fumarolicum]
MKRFFFKAFIKSLSPNISLRTPLGVIDQSIKKTRIENLLERGAEMLLLHIDFLRDKNTDWIFLLLMNEELGGLRVGQCEKGLGPVLIRVQNSATQ